MLPRRPYNLTNVLVAGRRLSGDAHGTDEHEAVRRFAAREARRLGADPAAAAAEALRAKGYKVAPKEADVVAREADALLAEPRDFSDWPMMLTPR